MSNADIVALLRLADVNERPLDHAAADEIEKLRHRIHELERTRSETEAQARVVGYRDGERDARQSIRVALGL